MRVKRKPPSVFAFSLLFPFVSFPCSYIKEQFQIMTEGALAKFMAMLRPPKARVISTPVLITGTGLHKSTAFIAKADTSAKEKHNCPTISVGGIGVLLWPWL